MPKNLIIGIIIIIILAAVLGVSVMSGKEKGGTINCDLACHKVGNNLWNFSGNKPTNNFDDKEECVSACKLRFPR